MKRLKAAALSLAFVIMLSGFAISPTLLAAQDATPETGQVFTAQIQEGACVDEGAVAFELEDVMLAPAGGTPVAAPIQMEEMHDVVLSSVTAVDISLADMLAGAYSLAVYDPADTSGDFVACANIAGEVRQHQRSDAPAGLVISLRQLEDSGYAGIAWLTPTDDGKTEVTVFVSTTFIGPGPAGRD